jgi:DNA polymerase-4
VLRHDEETMKRWFGERTGEWLWSRVHGESDAAVETGGDNHSMSRDETFAVDINDDAELERELLAMVTRAAFDMRGDGLAARTITVKLRDHDFRTRSARRTLIEAVVSDRVIMGIARQLLRKLRESRRVPARLIGISLSSFSMDPKADQLTLFEAMEQKDPLTETAKDRALAHTVDRVREKFGTKGIIPASLAKRRR